MGRVFDGDFINCERNAVYFFDIVNGDELEGADQCSVNFQTRDLEAGSSLPAVDSPPIPSGGEGSAVQRRGVRHAHRHPRDPVRVPSTSAPRRSPRPEPASGRWAHGRAGPRARQGGQRRRRRHRRVTTSSSAAQGTMCSAVSAATMSSSVGPERPSRRWIGRRCADWRLRQRHVDQRGDQRLSHGLRPWSAFWLNGQPERGPSRTSGPTGSPSTI